MKYILLNPLLPEYFNIESKEELAEAIEEFGCKVIESTGTTQYEFIKQYYVVSDTIEALQQLVTTVDLEGIILEVTGSVWDQQVTEADF
jgi:hypothetical protein